MHKHFCIVFLSLSLFSVSAEPQSLSALRITPEQVEALFLEQNLQIIAEKYNIDIAEAAVAQAKLWQNPSLSLGQLNLWSTDAQRGGQKEVVPPLFGNFGRNTEFNVEISQLVYTAGKRSKLVNREKVSKEIAVQQFEALLRGLKVELRKTINEIIYLQSYRRILGREEESLSRLVQIFRRQHTQGNIARTELLRLESSLLELENEQNEIEISFNQQQKVLKSLLNLSPDIIVEIESTPLPYQNPENLTLAALIEKAYEARPDMKLSMLQKEYYERSLKYEKSQRIPDIELGISYDRYGGIWKDFVGFSASIELPVFNRSQGNIKSAEMGIEQSENLIRMQQNLIEHEIAEVLSSYTLAYNFYQQIKAGSLAAELDSMLEVYMKNFINKNISLLEYIDFLNAYKSNKQTILNAEKKLDMLYQELLYAVGE